MVIKTFCIYKHTSPSGKVYIGLTSQENPNKRWNNGRGYEKQSYFYRAIQKYGWDNIKHEILESGLTEDEVEARERYWIDHYKSDNEKYGYNLTSGGYSNKCLTETALHNLRTAHILSQGKSVLCLETGILYRSITEASLSLFGDAKAHARISRFCHGQQFTSNGLHWCFSDKDLSDSERKLIIEQIELEKARAAEKGMYKVKNRVRKNSKQVKCIETNTIYSSIKEAARATGTNKRSIQGCLTGRQKSAGRHPVTSEKLHWRRID